MIVPFEPINEAKDYRLFQHIVSNDAVGFVTAFRNAIEVIENTDLLYRFPDYKYLLSGTHLTAKESNRKRELLNLVLNKNRARNDEVEQLISDFHFGFVKIDGAYVEKGHGEVTEETFVIYASHEDAEDLLILLKSLCKRYNQDSAMLILDDSAYKVTEKGRQEHAFAQGFGDARRPGGIHMRLTPERCGTMYSKVKGKYFRFGNIMEHYQRRPLGCQAEAYGYYSILRMLHEYQECFCEVFQSKCTHALTNKPWFTADKW